MKQPPPIEIKRHYRRLSEKQTAELASAVADLIVAFLKKRGHDKSSATPQADSSQTVTDKTERH